MLSPAPRTRGSLARRYKTVSYPVVEPIDVSLEQSAFRVQLNPARFDVINRIQTARIMAESILRRPLVQTSYDLFLDDEVYVQQRPLSPWGIAQIAQSQQIEITLNYPPCIAVQSVNVVDQTGVETVVDPSIYSVSRNLDPCRIRLNDWQDWPDRRGFEAFRIRFSAGYVVPFTVNSSGFLVASNHGFSIGDTVRCSSPAGPPPQPLQSATDYTIAAMTTTNGVSQISLNDPDGNPVTMTPSTDYAFLGEIPGPILRAISMLATIDRLSEMPNKVDPGRYSDISLPLAPAELLQPFIVPML